MLPATSLYRKRIASICLQFCSYLLSGLAALIIAVGVFTLFLKLGIWYVAASVLSDGVGFVIAFFSHKYLVFQKKEHVIPHAVRYTVLQIGNTAAQACFIYLLVQFGHIDAVVGRIVSIGLCVPINFFVYKYWVYV